MGYSKRTAENAFALLLLAVTAAASAPVKKVERVSVSSAGVQANADSQSPVVSADGRFVAYASRASNLVSGGTVGLSSVFLRDRLTGSTERVSVSSAGVAGNGN